MPNLIDKADMESFDVSLSISSGATATVTVVNKDNKYNPDNLLYKDIHLTLEINKSGTITTESLFSGVVNSVDEDSEQANNRLVVNCISYFSRFDKKPINTERYSATALEAPTTEELFNELVGSYGCMDDSLYDFSSATEVRFAGINISESSLADALLKVAQASINRLFVNNVGNLVAQPVITSAATFNEIQPLHIISANKQTSIYESISRVRVRGRYVSTKEKFSYSPKTIFSGTITWFNTVRTTRPEVRIKLDDAVNEIMQINSTVNVVNGADERVLRADGNYITISFDVSGSLADPGEHSTTATITTDYLDETEANSLGNSLQWNLKGPHTKVVKTLASEYGVAKPMQYRSIKPADEPEENRFEAIVVNTELQNLLGVLWEDLDNPYIPKIDSTPEQVEKVGVRYLQDILEMSKLWTLNCTYFPGILDLNRPVKFKKPESLVTAEKWQNGYTSEINVTYRAEDSSLKFSLTIPEISTTGLK